VGVRKGLSGEEAAGVAYADALSDMTEVTEAWRRVVPRNVAGAGFAPVGVDVPGRAPKEGDDRLAVCDVLRGEIGVREISAAEPGVTDRERDVPSSKEYWDSGEFDRNEVAGAALVVCCWRPPL